jgi:mono/diheme cytochrome c family protein
MRLRTTAAAGLFSLALLAGGCGRLPVYPMGQYVPPDQVTDFHTLYNTNCRACHGANGENGPAIDLANPEYQALVDDATLRGIVANGMPGTQMPAWAQSAGGMLTDAQVDAIVAGMRKEWLKPNAFDGATPPPYALPPAAGAKAAKNEAGDAKHGQQLYQAHCESCHTGPKRQELTSPVYLALISDQALRSIVIAGRPDIGQPDWRHDNGQLSAQDVTDIVAYLGSLRTSATISAPLIPLSSRR